MATALDSKLAVTETDVTECFICTKAFSDPRVLVCIHTFCLECLEALCENTKQGDQVSCPLCKKEFAIPCGGLKSLPRNFFVSKLLEVHGIQENRSIKIDYDCDVCSDTEEPKEQARMFCVDCQEHFCRSCSNCHVKQKMANSHDLVSIGCKTGCKEEIKMSDSFCSQHEEKLLEHYCFDCKAAICAVCFVYSDQSHNCSCITKDAK